MQTSSLVVSFAAAGALVVGSIGMADAQSSHARSIHTAAHAMGHTAHGSMGENPNLVPKRVTGRLPTLVGVVKGPRKFEISDRTPNPGRYKIVVRDTTSRHNWHLFGNGKSRATTVRGTDRWVFKIRLTAGNYRVVCDPHHDAMEFPVTVG